MSLKSLVKRLAPHKSPKVVAEPFWHQVKKNERFIYGVALRYTGQAFDAEDLVQQTLEVAFKRYAQLRDPDRFKRWVFVILRNIYLKSIRRPSAKAYHDSFDDQIDYIKVLAQAAQNDPSFLYEQKVLSHTVRQALAALSEPYQTVLILHYMEEHSYQEISRTLGIPIGTVMSRLSRAKQHLKKKLLQRTLQEKSLPIRRTKTISRSY